MNWDTIKLFLALHREGSARSVALALDLSPSTITRRISELEKELKTKLFNRLSSGFKLTESGQDLLHIALKMEEDVYEIERKLMANSGVMQGSIRLTIPNHIVAKLFIESLALFSEKHPQVEFEILPSDTAFDLSRGEADIALRIMMKDAEPPGHLIATHLVEVYCAVYASKQYIESHDLGDIRQSTWIGWDDKSRYPDWVRSSRYPHLPIKHRIDDAHTQLYCAKSHMGLVMLPCFMCDPEPDLVRISANEKWHRFDLWMLSHPDLRETLRFKEFRHFLKRQFESSNEIWRGEAYRR